MTSNQIQALKIEDMSERRWLKEIAFQLACIKENFSPAVTVSEEVEPIVKRGPGRPRKA